MIDKLCHVVLIFFSSLFFAYRVHSRFRKGFTEATFTILAFIAIRRTFSARASLSPDRIYIFYYLKTERSDVRHEYGRFGLLNVVKPVSARARHELHSTLFARLYG